MKLPENIRSRTFVIETDPVPSAERLGKFVLVKLHQDVGYEVEYFPASNLLARNPDTAIFRCKLVPAQVAFSDTQVRVQ